MFDLAFRFRSPEVLAVWLLAAVGGAALLYKFWPRLQRGRRLAALAASLFALHAVILAAWAAIVRVDSDEVSHLHCAWLVSQGLVPYRDFWQDHSPLLWYLLAPVVALFHSPAVLIFSRAVAGLLFLGVVAATAWLAWEVSRLRAAGVLAALIVFAFGVRTEAAWLRPDQLANLLALLSLVLAAKVTAGNRGGARWLAWLAGAAFGVALTFTPKPIFAAFAFPLVSLLAVASCENKGRGQRRLLAAAYYLLGLMAGFAPLVVLLARANVGSYYLFWVFLYHAPGGRVESYVPGALALVAFAGCAAVWVTRRASPAASPVAAPGSVSGSPASTLEWGAGRTRRDCFLASYADRAGQSLAHAIQPDAMGSAGRCSGFPLAAGLAAGRYKVQGPKSRVQGRGFFRGAGDWIGAHDFRRLGVRMVAGCRCRTRSHRMRSACTAGQSPHARRFRIRPLTHGLDDPTGRRWAGVACYPGPQHFLARHRRAL